MAIEALVAKTVDAVNGLDSEEYEDLPEYLSVGGTTFTLWAFQDGVAGVIDIDNLPLGGPGSDTTAVHVNIANEYLSAPLKGNPVTTDVLLIEDSQDSGNKKRISANDFLAAAGEVNDGLNLAGGQVDVFVTKTGLNLTFNVMSVAQFAVASNVISLATNAVGANELADDSVDTAAVIDNAITNAKAADMATQTIKGRNTAATGDPEDLAPATVVTMLGLDDAVQIDQANQFTTAPLLTFNSGHKILIENDAGGTKGYIDAGSLTAGGGGEINTSVQRGGGLVISDNTVLPNVGSQIPVRTLNTSQFSATSDLISLTTAFTNLANADQGLAANRTVDGSDSFSLDFTSLTSVAVDGDEIATLTANQAMSNKTMTITTVNGVNLETGGTATEFLSRSGIYATPAGGGGSDLTTEPFTAAAGETTLAVGKFGLLNAAGELLQSDTTADERLTTALEITSDAGGGTWQCTYRQITLSGLTWDITDGGAATNSRIGLLSATGVPQHETTGAEKAVSAWYFIRNDAADSIWADLRSHTPTTTTTESDTYPFLIDAAGSTGLADDPNLVDGKIYTTLARDNTSGGNGAGTYRFVAGDSTTADEGRIVTHASGRLFIIDQTDQRTDAWWYPGQNADPAEWDWADRCNQFLQGSATADQTAQPPRVVWVPDYVLTKRTVDVNQYQPDGTTVLAGTNIRFEGEGSQQALIELAASLTTIGINALRADEFIADGFKMIEASGSQTSTLMAVGGTTSRVRNCWFAGAYQGIELIGGTGAVVRDNVFESCVREMHVGTRYNDSTRGMETTGANISRIVSKCRIIDNQFSKGILEVIHYSQMTLTGVTGGTVDIGDVITDDTTGGTSTVLDAWDDTTNRVVVVRKLESDTQAASNTFTATGGVTGTISLIQSNTMDDIRIVGNTFNGAQNANHTNKSKIHIEAGSNIVVDSQLTDSDIADAPVLSIDGTLGYRLGGIFSENSTGVIVKSGHGVVNGVVSNIPMAGTAHGEDIAITDSDVKISGNHWGNTGAYAVGGTVEQSSSGMQTKNGCLDFNRTDVSVIMPLPSFFDGTLQRRVDFILARKPTKNSFLISQGLNASNAFQIHYLNGALQFEVIIAGDPWRIVINDPVMLGKYSVTFVGGGPPVIVVKPNGDALTSPINSQGSAYTLTDTSLYIGQRSDGNSGFFTDASLVNIVLIDESFTAAHEYRGYGHDTEQWKDLVEGGRVDGTVNGAAPATAALALSPVGGLIDARNTWQEAQRYSTKEQSSVGGALTVNAAFGPPEVDVLLFEDITDFRVANLGQNQVVTLNIAQDATGGHAVTFNAAIQGTPPTINAGANELTIVQIKGIGTAGTPYFAASPV